MKKLFLLLSLFTFIFIGCDDGTAERLALENGYSYRIEKQVPNSDHKQVCYGVKHLTFFAPVEFDTIGGQVILTKGAMETFVNSTYINRDGGGPKVLGHFEAPVTIIYLGGYIK
jgi:hypothetical protein